MHQCYKEPLFLRVYRGGKHSYIKK